MNNMLNNTYSDTNYWYKFDRLYKITKALLSNIFGICGLKATIVQIQYL